MSRCKGLTPEEIITKLNNISEFDSEESSEESDVECSADDSLDSNYCFPKETESFSEEDSEDDEATTTCNCACKKN